MIIKESIHQQYTTFGVLPQVHKKRLHSVSWSHNYNMLLLQFHKGVPKYAVHATAHSLKNQLGPKGLTTHAGGTQNILAVCHRFYTLWNTSWNRMKIICTFPIAQVRCKPPECIILLPGFFLKPSLKHENCAANFTLSSPQKIGTKNSSQHEWRHAIYVRHNGSTWLVSNPVLWGYW